MLLCGLIGALLLLQTLGVVHAVVHHTAQGPLPRGAAPVPAAPPAADRAVAPIVPAAAPASKRTATGWTHLLFAGHDAGSSACALYEQLVQPVLPIDTVCSANPAFAPPVPAEPPRVGRFAPQALGFLARGPPPLASDA